MSQQQFLEEVSALDQAISEVKASIAEIKELHEKLLGVTSGSGSQQITQQLDAKAEATKKSLFNIKDRLKQIEKDNLRSKESRESLRWQRYEFLKDKFSTLLEEYQKLEGEYKRKHQERLTRQYHVVYPDASQADIDVYLENSSNVALFQQATLHSEARAALAEVQKRHEDIKQIEQTITELAALFQEVQLQVELQDEALVDVEENVEETLIKVETSANLVQQATESAAAARNKKWILFGIIASILAIIIVVAISKLSKKSPTTTTNG